ncbi:MAG: lytic transglycosylase domain-containing protein [Ferruginibacter sp.]
MKNSIINALVCFIAVILSVSTATAENITDTTQKLLAVTAKKPSATAAKTVLLKGANVVYPAILEEHKEEASAYVEKFSKNRKDYLVRTYQRSRRWFPKINKILNRYQVPSEFAVLMALESGFNGKAKSGAGAYGYWQFMDAVAKEYGLKIVEEEKVETVSKKDKKKNAVAAKKPAEKKKAPVDERSHFGKSTHAAARYLRDRARNFDNDYLLMVASYNYGSGNVKNAMARSGKANPTFWDIQKFLPAETKAYVLNFIALNVVFKNYNKFIVNQLVFTDVCTEEKEADIQSLEILPEVLGKTL